VQQTLLVDIAGIRPPVLGEALGIAASNARRQISSGLSIITITASSATHRDIHRISE
jgi:hypothetical protein